MEGLQQGEKTKLATYVEQSGAGTGSGLDGGEGTRGEESSDHPRG